MCSKHARCSVGVFGFSLGFLQICFSKIYWSVVWGFGSSFHDLLIFVTAICCSVVRDFGFFVQSKRCLRG